MYDLRTFRNRVQDLYHAANPFEDGHRPTQSDLARELGFSRTELSRRLSGRGDVELTCANARAIIQQLGAWGALQSQAEAVQLLDLLACPPFTSAEWQSPPLDRLASLDPLALAHIGQRTHNLPAPLSSFIGRELELVECKQLLVGVPPGCRLLTITGVGGVGKSRFAVELARSLLDRYADGVWLVKLAPLTDSRLINGVVANALGVREEAGREFAATLDDYLRSRNLLLILDNCEHLLDGVAELAERLLANCPHLSIVATSREPLNLAGESRQRLPPLTTPNSQAELTLTQLAEYEAGALFVARARAVSPSFRLTRQNAPAIAQICARLDGIALAIELAAAQVEGISVGKLAQRLDDRLSILTGGLRTDAPHQQTLRASIEWSYALLRPSEQALLRRLSVFAGGWSLEAAEAVCTGDFRLQIADFRLNEEPPTTQSQSVDVHQPNLQSTIYNLQSSEVLAGLIQLVNKSLVVAAADEPMRYSLLETIRQFAAEQLRAHGEAEAVSDQHAALYLTLAEAAERGLAGAQQGEWLARLEVEHDNLRAALSWTLAHNAENAARLVAGFWRFWNMHGYLSEGRGWLEATLAQSNPTPSPLRANLLNAAGWLAEVQGDYSAADTLLHQSLAMAKAIGNTEIEAKALNSLGVMSWNLGDYPAAERLLGQSLELRQALDDRWGATQSLNNLGIIAAEQGNYPRAAQIYEQSISIQRELADKYGIAASLNNLAAVALYQGDYPAAQHAAEECLALSREMGDKDGIALALLNLASAMLFQKAYPEANALFEECLSLTRELGDRTGIVQALNGLASVAYQRANFGQAVARYKESLTIAKELDYKLGAAVALDGLAHVATADHQPERGARLFGAAAALRQAINTPLHPADQGEHEQAVAALRQQLGEVAFSRAWAVGQALDLLAAIEYALTSRILDAAMTSR